MIKTKQVVIDTNVCLDLFVFKDPRWEFLLRGLMDNSIVAVTRADCRQEWLAVLHYPHLPVDDESRPKVVETFDSLIQCIAPERQNRLLPRCSDKDDQKFLEIALDAGVQTLITKDKALLKLGRKTRLSGYYNIETPEQFIVNMSKNDAVMN
jgi:putative PIN family toxin of toxin-antitoxin system